MNKFPAALWKRACQHEEQWIQWRPRTNLRQKYHVVSLLQRLHYFEIELIDCHEPELTLFMRFDLGVGAYEKIDIRLAKQLLHKLDVHYGASFHREWSFFIVQNSHYLTWLSEESSTISEIMQPKHLVIIAQNCVINIADPFDPTFWSSYDD